MPSHSHPIIWVHMPPASFLLKAACALEKVVNMNWASSPQQEHKGTSCMPGVDSWFLACRSRGIPL
eukprot:361616-Chlamydomonas_euryale.AAC.19